MSTGAQRADAQPEDGSRDNGQHDRETLSQAAETGEAAEWAAEPDDAPAGRKPLAAALILLAGAWAAAALWAVAGGAGGLAQALQWIAVASAPPILLGLVWLIFGRTPRREAERFTRAVAAMHGESAALETMLAIVAGRLEENHARLTNEAAKLMALGDEASDRLGRVTYYLSKEGKALDVKAAALEAAAAAARVDIGVLLQDLPRAEEQARSLGGALRETGVAAHEQAQGLEGQLSALVSRGREADEVVGGAAQRLAAHLARIESNAASAATRIDEAAAGMTAAVDGTMERAAEAIDGTRVAIEQQGAALLAMTEQSRAAFERAGDETGRSLAQRLAGVSAEIERLAGRLAAQDAGSRTLVTGLSKELAELDARFAGLGASGANAAAGLGEAIAAVRASVGDLAEELAGGEGRAVQLIGRARDMAEALTDISGQLNGALPTALERVEQQARRAGEAATAIAPAVEAIEASSAAAAAKLQESGQSAAGQQEALRAMLAIVEDGVRSAEQRLQALARAVGEADDAAARIVSETGPELVEALVRVRETANQSAHHAREAIAAVIPQSAAALAEASRHAVSNAITAEVAATVEELNRLAERAAEAGRKASESLTRQMLTVGKSAAAVEERIEEARREREESQSEAFSRRVALLIESLNSTAIDVTKILSNEVTDSAWSAYLKGDRGVFTRRAVRLLDATEAREIVQHYEAEPEFREQVNRYIGDFETMLRRVLAEREGSPLGVTILSSDMGKLYVALAQAIERLRA
ncbi:MAG TPA: hypothetical protein VGW34_12125 [Allosphingosinicella sp.]|nr:hypothetical protein [Allosphingosinicella sp.]